MENDVISNDFTENTDNFDNFTPPENVLFGGGVELPESNAEEVQEQNEGLEVSVKEVPTKNNPIYSDQSVKRYSVGSPSYLSTLADRIGKAPSKISTGIPELDYICGGGWSSSMSCVAAAPGTGKTTILIQSAVRMAQQGTAVVYITNDMRELDLVAKVISGISYELEGEDCLTIGDILNRGALSSDTDHIKKVMEKVEKTLPYLHIRDLIFDTEFDKACDYDPNIANMDKIERIFHVYCNTYEKVVFIADSLQQIAGYKGSGKEGVDTQLRQFKQLSRKYNAPIIMISTLNRTGYSKQGEIVFSDLKESGSIEYDCDTIVTMLPRFVVKPDLNMDLKAFKKSSKREVVLNCIKSRDSAERDITMTLYAPGCTFIPYIEEDSEGEDNEEKQSAKEKRATGKNTPSPIMPPLGHTDWSNVDL